MSKRKPVFEYWESSWRKLRKGRYCTEWCFHYKAGNGRIICHSEMYSSKRACLHAIGLMQADVPFCEIVQLPTGGA